MSSKLEEYIDEMEQDLQVDELNIKEVQMKLPALKHKWVGRLMRHKSQIGGLHRRKQDLSREASKKMKEGSMYNMSDAGLSKLIEKQQPIIDINQEIAAINIIVEFLEKSERIFHSLSFDIKNLIEIMKLETL